MIESYLSLMQSTTRNKKVRVRVKNRRFKKLSMFQLQNRADSNCWGNWVSRRSI
jgi:hypothetical protein